VDWSKIAEEGIIIRENSFGEWIGDSDPYSAQGVFSLSRAKEGRKKTWRRIVWQCNELSIRELLAPEIRELQGKKK